MIEPSSLAGVLAPPAVPAASLAERAYRVLQTQIITLELEPGSLIREEDLRRELELGRTPIREALQRLNFENLVTILPRRGTFVSEINITDLAAIYELRLPLEGTAARLAAQRVTDDDRTTIAAVIGELAGAAGSDYPQLLRLDHRLHHLVYELARNSFLEEMLDRYLNLSIRILFAALKRLPTLSLTFLEDAVLEHRELLEAIETGDTDRAEAIARHHVTGFEAELRKAL